ncbi:MAG: PAS domain S-box protein [Bdellovibrionia bacterium]
MHFATTPNDSSPGNKIIRPSRENIAAGAAALSVFIGSIVLIGWQFDIPTLKSISPHWVAMKIHTALGFILAGVSLWFLRKDHTPPIKSVGWYVAKGSAVVLVMISSFTLLHYLLSLHPESDRIFLNKFIISGMGMNAALSFLLLGLSLLMIDIKSIATIGQFFALAVGLLTLLPIAGYAFTFLDSTKNISALTDMALHSALSFMMLSLGVFFSHSSIGFSGILVSKTIGGLMARRLLPAILIIPVITGWLSMAGQKKGLLGAELGVTTMVLLSTILLASIVAWTVNLLNRMDTERDQSVVERDRFFTVSLDMLCIAGTDGYFKRVNPAFTELLGYTEKELCAKTMLDFIHPEDKPKTLQEIGKLAAGHTVLSFENRYRRRDGTYKWLSWKSTPVADVIYAAARDITEFKNAQISLSDSEARLRAIFDSAITGLVGMNAEGMITEWNPRAETIFGWNKSEVIGQRLSDILIPPEQRELHERGMKHFLSTGEGPILNQTIEVKALKKSGELFLAQLSISPVKIQGTYIFTAFIADVTERRQIERERAALLISTQAAEEASRLKSEFLANMSHEIRTPLNGVIGMADLLLETSLDDQQYKYAKIVQDSGAGLLTIINDILDFSKIEAGMLNIEVIDFALVSLVEGQTELLASRAHEKGLSIMTFIDSEIPNELKGDPGRIGQVILNLVGNAIKFTSGGTIVVRAMLDSETDTRLVVKFSISDNGIGLSQEVQGRLFHPFTQADGSTARKFGGTGLGLSISKRLVELMGGKIGVESELGQGSTFWFTAEFLKSDTRVAPTRRIFPDKFLPIRVLIVDSDAPSREIISRYMTNWKIEAVTVPNKEEALKALKEAIAIKRYFHLMTIDKKLSTLDGTALGEQIKTQLQVMSTKLILTSAFGKPTNKELLHDAGFSENLTKPIKQSELYNSIVDVLHLDDLIVQRASALKGKTKKEPLFGEPNKIRILVAEDNPVNQLVAISMLKNLGYIAFAVASGYEVLDTLKQVQYDLVLMDCQMPEMDGYQTTEAIRKLELNTKHRIPIIALTANAMKEDKEKCLACGMDSYISKPIKKEQLDAIIRQYVPSLNKKTV